MVTKKTAADDTPDQLAEALEANKEFEEANTKLADDNEKLLAKLAQAEKEAAAAKAEATKAKNQIVSLSRSKEFADNPVGQDGVRRFIEDDDGNPMLTELPNGRLTEAELWDKARMLKFMDEPVGVHIIGSGEDHDAFGFTIMVNGETRTFFRNQKITIPRRFVEGLARARKTTYRCEELDKIKNDNGYEYPSMTNVRYNFSVIKDTPEGIAWLDRVRMEA